MEVIIAITGCCVAWILIGWFGYGLANQVRFDQWSAPKLKKEGDLTLFKVCLFGGPISAFIAGVILGFQVLDTMSQ